MLLPGPSAPLSVRRKITLAVVLAGRRKTRRQVVLDVDAELGGQLCNMDPKHTAQLPKGIREHPSRRPVHPRPRSARPLAKLVRRGKELTTSSSHCPEMRNDLVITVVELAEDAGEKPPNLTHGVDAMTRDLDVPWGIEHPPVLKVGKHLPRKSDVGGAGIPRHTEHGAGNPREAPSRFGEPHRAPGWPSSILIMTR
jgi:hypothetical protein